MNTLAELFVDDHYAPGFVLFEEDEEVESTFFIVREGKVKLTSTSDKYNDTIIEKGGYFGDEMLCRDAQYGIVEGKDPTSKARYKVEMLEQTCLACLTLEECRTAIDTTTIGKGARGAHRFSSIKGCDIQFAALKKHSILGAGTFGQVWLTSRLASDGETRVPYALKIQSKYELLQSQQAKGVIQEKEIMSQLQHPFIIKLVNTYQDRARVYMLLGIVQGGELFSIMHTEKGDGVPEDHARFYAAGILEGLTYMHRRHILYRDLKPENVLIDQMGYPVIVDLGFGKLLAGDGGGSLFNENVKLTLFIILLLSQIRARENVYIVRNSTLHCSRGRSQSRSR